MKVAEILLVEDNPDDAELTMMALARSGVTSEVTLARDGQEALDRLLDERRELPALVVLDLQLPRVGGLEVLRRVRAEERTRLTRVVALTTSTEQVDLAEAFGSGVNAYVRKPVDSDEFAEAVHNLGLFWLVVSEAPPAGTRR